MLKLFIKFLHSFTDYLYQKVLRMADYETELAHKHITKLENKMIKLRKEINILEGEKKFYVDEYGENK